MIFLNRLFKENETLTQKPAQSCFAAIVRPIWRNHNIDGQENREEQKKFQVERNHRGSSNLTETEMIWKFGKIGWFWFPIQNFQRQLWFCSNSFILQVQ